MPFQSEKQRRYLWANEPEIARDWTDTYGSKIQKANGGRIGFAKGSHPRALKQRFIEVIRLMNEAEGDELAALALEARTLKEQMETLQQIEPFIGQGIQSLQRRGEPQRTSLLSKDLSTSPLTPDDEDYQIFPEGYGREQIFPGIRTDPISAQQVQFTKQKPIYRAVKGRMDRKTAERFKEMLERRRPSRDLTDTDGSRVRKQSGGITETILMQLAKTYGINKAMEMLGMGTGSDQEDKTGGYFGNMNLGPISFNPGKALTRFGLNKAFSGLTGGGAGSGFMKALGPIGAIAGMGYLLNKNRLGLTGYATQRGYEKARQDRINMKRQSNIIKTLQSGKYVPGWDKTAFDRVQKLGENLNLVDAADVGLTGRSKSKPRGPVGPPPGGGPHGNGGANQGNQSSRGGAPSHSTRDLMAYGGLAGLWPR